MIERVVRRYDPNGSPGPAERLRIEEQKQADGSVKTLDDGLARRYQWQLSGCGTLVDTHARFRRSDGKHHVGGTAHSERRLRTVRTARRGVTKSGPKTVENATTYRKDPNGRLSEAAKKTREAVAENGVVNENTAEYETASTGQMRLARQSTARVDPTGHAR